MVLFVSLPGSNNWVIWCASKCFCEQGQCWWIVTKLQTVRSTLILSTHTFNIEEPGGSRISGLCATGTSVNPWRTERRCFWETSESFSHVSHNETETIYVYSLQHSANGRSDARHHDTCALKDFHKYGSDGHRQPHMTAGPKKTLVSHKSGHSLTYRGLTGMASRKRTPCGTCPKGHWNIKKNKPWGVPQMGVPNIDGFC